ncbi:ankyrin repeat-containing protein [Anaeramoeba ignava]|uniref:Ankyrin repeat-containing protein n=1 Tax=Anaeramoeba ignava TaxID=1746090 RepID=A0A9Q0LMF1_ANAIG|nr:ankyrin repeat-containing protein [Anaeramoeba ignava]
MQFQSLSILQNLIKKNQIELIKNFLKENELTNKDLSKCLTFSLMNSSTTLQIVELLIQSGADINHRNPKSRRTALLTAIRHSSSSEIVGFLIKSGTNLNLNLKDRRKRTVLFYLMKYLRSDTLELLNLILEKGVDINYKDNLLQTPLSYAIINQQPIEVVKYLIEKGAETNILNIHQENLLHICAKYNPNVDLLQLLIDKGIQINNTTKYLKTPLSYLVVNYPKTIPEIKFLVSKRANIAKSLFSYVMDPKFFEAINFVFSLSSVSINQKNQSNQTLLHCACLRKNNIKIIEVIIQNGVDVNVKDSMGNTALHLACQNDLENEVIKLLISSGIDPSITNTSSSYALEYFHKWNSNESEEISEIMVLLFKGIDLAGMKLPRLSENSWRNLFNNNKYNSEIIKIVDQISDAYDSSRYFYRRVSIENFLIYSYKNLEVFKFLFEKSLKSKKTNYSNIVSKISNYVDSSAAIIYILESLENHPEIDIDVNTALFNFSSTSHGVEQLKLFIKKGANVNTQNDQKVTVLMRECHHYPSFSNISFLIESGANAFSRDNKGNTIIHHFCKSSTSYFQPVDIHELIQLFKSTGLDINDTNDEKEDALICSCSNFSFPDELIRYLIENGANLNSTNKSGMSAFSLYLQNKKHRLETVKLFIEKGINQKTIETSFVNWIQNKIAINQSHPLETFKFFFENNILENKQKILFENSVVLHYLLDYYNMKGEEFNDLLLLFINNGANYEVEMYQKKTLLHSICTKNSSFIPSIKFLLNLNLDVNALTSSRQTPLSLACRYATSEEIIPILLSQGANPNYPEKCIDLITKNITLIQYNSKCIEYLLWYGAEWKNQKSFNSYERKINQLFLKTYKSYQEDFLNLFKRQELTDYKIQCKDGFILVHKLIITLRLYLENESEKQILGKFLNFAFETSKKEMEIIIEFLYSGIIEMSNYEEHFQFLEKFAQNLSFPKNWITQKSAKIGLIHDLERLYQDQESKDFTIIFSDETTIKVHKLILIARSNLFRGMFLSVVDNSNQVHDYSEIPSKTMKSLIDFLYLDSCSSFENFEIEHFQKAKDYFQLNENSSLNLFFSQSSLANRYFNDKYLNKK